MAPRTKKGKNSLAKLAQQLLQSEDLQEALLGLLGSISEKPEEHSDKNTFVDWLLKAAVEYGPLLIQVLPKLLAAL